MILGASSSLQEKMSEAACAQAADTESNGYFTAKKSLSLLTLLRRYKSFLENSPETYFCTYKDLASSWQALGKPRQAGPETYFCMYKGLASSWQAHGKPRQAGVFFWQARVSDIPNVCVFIQTCAQESRPSTPFILLKGRKHKNQSSK